MIKPKHQTHECIEHRDGYNNICKFNSAITKLVEQYENIRLLELLRKSTSQRQSILHAYALYGITPMYIYALCVYNSHNAESGRARLHNAFTARPGEGDFLITSPCHVISAAFAEPLRISFKRIYYSTHNLITTSWCAYVQFEGCVACACALFAGARCKPRWVEYCAAVLREKETAAIVLLPAFPPMMNEALHFRLPFTSETEIVCRYDFTYTIVFDI